jgi:hypothetical protein
MLEFKYNGIEVKAISRDEAYEYLIGENRKRTGYDKITSVQVSFWDFIIQDGDLYELAFVKSVCTYFMQAYWKRATKEGNRILLEESLPHVVEGKEYSSSTLCFAARQKNKINKLYVCLKKDDEVANEIYLSGREVIMVDVALGKAISILKPETIRTTPPSVEKPKTA